MTLDVLYVDNHLLVINKPPGLLSQADATGDADVLSLSKTYVKERFDKPGNVFLGLVHRLDRPASGVMALARTSKAAARLSEQFRMRTPSKHYLAIVEGHASIDGQVTDYLRKDDQRHVHVVSASTPGAQRAELDAQVIARGQRDGHPVSLIFLDLGTGRSHQIRVQLAHRGHPIVGDFRYGSTQPLDGKNLALHACRLSLDHPTRRERMTWTAFPASTWDAFAEPVAEVLAD